MSLKIVRAAFESRLKTWADAQTPILAIAWQNVPFTGVAPYLKAFILPATTISQDLKGDHRAYKGVFQVSVVYPAGIGSGAAETTAKAIADLFPVNLYMDSVLVLSPMSIGPAIQDSTEYMLPVSCQYRLDTI